MLSMRWLSAGWCACVTGISANWLFGGCLMVGEVVYWLVQLCARVAASCLLVGCLLVGVGCLVKCKIHCKLFVYDLFI